MKRNKTRKGFIMRRLVSFALAVLFLLGIVSCNVFEPDNKKLETSTNITAPTKHNLFKINNYNIYFVAGAPSQIAGYIEFSREMNTSSVESNFIIYPVTANNTLGASPLDPITFNWVNNNTKLEFETVNIYDNTQSYLIKISKNAKDSLGNGLYGNYTGVTCDKFTPTDWYYSWNVSAFSYDYIKPGCYIEENDGGTLEWDMGDFGNITTSDSFTIHFNEEVTPSDVNATNITFSPAVSFNITTTDNISYTLVPTAPLTADTDYTISINMNNIIDTNNNSGSDGRADGNDNVVMVKFNTYTTLTDALHYSGYSWDIHWTKVKFWFNTPNTDNDYLDHSTINYNTISIKDSWGNNGGNFTIEVEDSILDKRTYIIIKSVDNESLRWRYVNFSYKIADIDGNTLDGNGNNRLEGDERDDYNRYIN